jgi:hypothetical protein
MRARAKELFAVLLVGVPLIMISIAYWDRPLAQWSATHELHFRGRTLLTSVPSAALPVALAVPFLGMFATPRLLASQLWTMLNRLAVSVLWTAAAIELAELCQRLCDSYHHLGVVGVAEGLPAGVGDRDR